MGKQPTGLVAGGPASRSYTILPPFGSPLAEAFRSGTLVGMHAKGCYVSRLVSLFFLG